MKVTTLSKSVKITETKLVEYDNGITCQYSLVNGLVNNIEFLNKDVKLNFYITNSKDFISSNTHLDPLKGLDLISINNLNEADIHNFEDFDKLYSFAGGILFDYKNIPVCNNISLNLMMHHHLHIPNNYNNMKAFTDFINNHPDLIADVKLEIVPEYNHNYDLDYTQYDLAGQIRFKDPVKMLKYCAAHKGSKHLSTSKIKMDLANEFMTSLDSKHFIEQNL